MGYFHELFSLIPLKNMEDFMHALILEFMVIDNKMYL